MWNQHSTGIKTENAYKPPETLRGGFTIKCAKELQNAAKDLPHFTENLQQFVLTIINLVFLHCT